MAKISRKQLKFVNEYLKCFNATEAARRADYAHPNKQGPRLLANTIIYQQIEKRFAENTMSANEALHHLTRIARGDITLADLFIVKTMLNTDEDGMPHGFSTSSVNWAAVKQYGYLIKSLSFTSHGPRIEFHDRLKALELIGKHHGLFTDKHEHSFDRPPTIILCNDCSD